MTEIVYASGWSSVQDGRQFSNARLFSRPNLAAKKVFVVGNWPKIVAAYQRLNIPVEVVDGRGTSKPAPVPRPKQSKAPKLVLSPPVKAVLAEDSGLVAIPDDFGDLDWKELRALSKQLSDTPAINSKEAWAVIESELARRS